MPPERPVLRCSAPGRCHRRLPERAVCNNALLERDLATAERADAIDKLESAYAAASVSHFAVWVHETDDAMCSLERRAYTLDARHGHDAGRHPAAPAGDRIGPPD